LGVGEKETLRLSDSVNKTIPTLIQSLAALVVALSSYTTTIATQPLPIVSRETYSTTTAIYEYPLSEWVGIVYEKASTTKLAELTLEIIKKESQGWPNAKNPASTASGLMQFLDKTFLHECVEKYQIATSTTQKNDPYIQIDCGLKMLAEPDGINHWSASGPHNL